MYDVYIFDGEDYTNEIIIYKYLEISDAYKKANEIRKTASENEITGIRIFKNNNIIWSWYYDIDDEEEYDI